jgi:hypothetical protein
MYMYIMYVCMRILINVMLRCFNIIKRLTCTTLYDRFKLMGHMPILIYNYNIQHTGIKYGCIATLLQIISKNIQRIVN